MICAVRGQFEVFSCRYFLYGLLLWLLQSHSAALHLLLPLLLLLLQGTLLELLRLPHRAMLLLGLELRGSPVLGRLFGAKRRRALERADELLDAVGLKGAADKYPQGSTGAVGLNANGKSNFAFADGHAKTLNPVATNPDPVNQPQNNMWDATR